MSDGAPRPVRLVHVVTVPQTFVFLEGQTGYMKARGFEVVGVSSPGPYQTTFAERERVELHSVEMPRRITPLRDLVSVLRLARLLRRLRPTIVHAHTPKGGLLGMMAAWLARVPVRIYHIRGLPYVTAAGRRRALLTWSERIAARLSHRVFCVSHSLRRLAIADGIVAEEKIVTFLGGSGNGVDATGRFDPDHPAGDREARRQALRARLGIPAGAVVVAFVGRVVRDKGVGELAEAWTSLAPRFPGAHLLVAGPLEPQDPVDPATLHTLRTHPRVHLLGESDTRDVYSAADLVVLPTYREGLPNVPLEAAAMRLPVVATRIPGCADAVRDGETGRLVPPRDAAALADAIALYLADPALRAADGERGRQMALTDFSREAIWEAVYAEYRRLLTAR